MQKRQSAPEPGREPAYPIASVDNALRLLMLFRGENTAKLVLSVNGGAGAA